MKRYYKELREQCLKLSNKTHRDCNFRLFDRQEDNLWKILIKSMGNKK